MAVSDGMEDGLMDQEEREALDMTREGVLALPRKRARGARRMPRRLRKRQDMNRGAEAVAAGVTERTESGLSFAVDWHTASVVITGARFEEEGPVELSAQSSVIVQP